MADADIEQLADTAAPAAEHPLSVFVMLTDDGRHPVYPYLFTTWVEALKAARDMARDMFGRTVLPLDPPPESWEVGYRADGMTVWVVRRFVYEHAWEI